MTIPIRYSHLSRMSRSALHYQAAASGTYYADTPAMRTGRLVHGLVLGGPSAPVVYEGDRRGKAWQEFQLLHDGAEIVTRAEADRAIPIADAVLGDPIAGPLVRAVSARREKRIEWSIGGRACAGTPDSYDPATGILLDLKTTTSARPADFARHTWAYHYHGQLSWYRHALETLGESVSTCLLVAVETAAPYGVSVHRLSSRILAEGERSWRAWWEQLMVCEATGQWPGYAESIVDLDVPAWLADIDEGEDDA